MPLMSFAFSFTVRTLPTFATAQSSFCRPPSCPTRTHSHLVLIPPNGCIDTPVHLSSHIPQSNSRDASNILSMASTNSTLSIPNWNCRDAGYRRRAHRANIDNALPPLQDADGDDAGGFGGSNGDSSGDGGDGQGPHGNDHSQGLIGAYFRLLEKRALQTKVVTSALLTLLSDLIAQTFEQGGKLIYDGRRLFALFLVGGVLTAPMFHVLYGVLESALPTGAGLGNLFAQLAVDQLIAAPLWLVAFFGLVALFEGRFETGRVVRQMERDFVPTMKLTWTIFPPVQLASFALLKPSLRVLALNVVDLGYTTALSYIKHRPHGGDETKGSFEKADKGS